MANQYTPYDSGLFESAFQAGFKLKDYSNALRGDFGMDNEYVIQGTKSGKVVVTSDAAISNGVKAVFSTFNFRSVPTSGFFNEVALTPGRYKMTLNAITLLINPVAQDEALVGLCNNAEVLQQNGTWTDLGGGQWKFTYGSGNIEVILWKVSALKGTLRELSYTWDEPAGTANLTYRSPQLVIILKKSTLPFTTTIPIAATQNLLIGGKLFFDEAYLDLSCTLAFGAPAYTKTDETAFGANDGTATINATTASGPLQYRIDGGAYQLSNIFTGLAPGLHSVDVIDSGCGPINTTLTIGAAPPPPPAPGPLVIDEKPINSYNFVPWFNRVSGSINFNSFDCINHFWDLPKGYDVIRKKQRHAFVVQQNEEFSFYINFDSPILATQDFTKLRLALVRNTGSLDTNIAPLIKDTNLDGTYNVYANVTITSLYEEGFYRLVIWDISNNNVLWVSGDMEVMTEEDADTYTTRLIYRHSQNVYHYNYVRVEVTNFNKIRIRMNSVDEQTEATISQYRAASSGQLRNKSFELDKWIKLETYYFDVHGIRGMYSFQICE